MVVDDALVTEQPQDACARDLQDIRDVVVGQARQWMEDELARFVLEVDPVQSDGVKMGIQSQIRAHALHGGDSATLAAADPTCLEVTPVPAQRRVYKRMAYGAGQLAVVGESRSELERQREQHAVSGGRS